MRLSELSHTIGWHGLHENVGIMCFQDYWTLLLRFLQPGLRRRRGQARTLTLHQDIIDDISAINQFVKSITSASKSYFDRIVATLSIT